MDEGNGAQRLPPSRRSLRVTTASGAVVDDQEFVPVYECIYDGPLAPDGVEVAAVRWQSPAQLRSEAHAAPHHFTCVVRHASTQTPTETITLIQTGANPGRVMFNRAMRLRVPTVCWQTLVLGDAGATRRRLGGTRAAERIERERTLPGAMCVHVYLLLL
jgi:hypothetical protein